MNRRRFAMVVLGIGASGWYSRTSNAAWFKAAQEPAFDPRRSYGAIATLAQWDPEIVVDATEYLVKHFQTVVPVAYQSAVRISFQPPRDELKGVISWRYTP